MHLLCRMRSALVPLTMPLVGLMGIPVLIWTRSRRTTINFCTGLWADLSCALIGLRIEVRGDEHLDAPRPAVFILNHQSNADGFLVARLIRRDIAYMGKKELSRHPVRSRLMQMGGLILVDREHAGRAGAAMQAMIEAIRVRRLSAALFPEGRRSQSLRMGSFKKGAFLIALRARVPIVPIVIHNSIDAQHRGESFYRPARVRIEVLPPIATEDWLMRDLDNHIDAIHARFLEVLGQDPEAA